MRAFQRGNMLVVIAVLLTGLFAVGGFAIETTLYLLRRAEVQQIAESIAMGASLSLPFEEGALTSAQGWYNSLRIQDGKEILPARKVNDGDGFTITFIDNGTARQKSEMFLVQSLTVRIVVEYEPKVLPVPGGREIYRIVGEATAQLQPTDVVLVVENSPAFIDQDWASIFIKNAGINFNTAQIFKTAQCMSPEWRRFKEGIIRLYEQLAEVGTFRVALMTSNSRTGTPNIVLPLGATKTTPEALEFDGDQPGRHSSMCAGFTEMSEEFQIPASDFAYRVSFGGAIDKNSTPGWEGFAMPLKSGAVVSGREAIWLLPAGYSTDSAYVRPDSYYQSPTAAFDLAGQILTNSRRDDGLPVGQRLIIYVTDKGFLNGNTLAWATPVNAYSLDTGNYCSYWRNSPYSQNKIKLGVVYYGHSDLKAHAVDSTEVQAMRSHCLIPGTNQEGIFFAEASKVGKFLPEQFATDLMPLVAFATKQTEIAR